MAAVQINAEGLGKAVVILNLTLIKSVIYLLKLVPTNNHDLKVNSK